MRRAPLLGGLLVATLAAGPPLAAGAASPSLTIVTPDVELGTVVPEQPLVVAAGLRVVIDAPAVWQLALVRDPPAGAGAPEPPTATTGGQQPESDLSIRVAEQQWAPLIVGNPTPLASGGPTGEDRLTLLFDLMATATMDSPTGRYEVPAHFVLNGQPVAPALRLAYDVAPLLGLAPDGHPFQLASPIDPTRAGTYEFAPRTFVVSGNVAWVLEIGLKGRPAESSGSRTLADGAIVLLPASGEPQPLLAGASIAVGSGAAPGHAGHAVELRLGVTVTGHEVAGSYDADLVVTAKEADASPTAGSAAALPVGRGIGVAVPPRAEPSRARSWLGGSGPSRWSLNGRVEQVVRLR